MRAHEHFAVQLADITIGEWGCGWLQQLIAVVDPRIGSGEMPGNRTDAVVSEAIAIGPDLEDMHPSTGGDVKIFVVAGMVFVLLLLREGQQVRHALLHVVFHPVRINGDAPVYIDP